jgi:ferrous iron transport protein B
MYQDKKIIRIALAGNPNSGKSTLFNILTGLNQKTGNFPGVTVDKKTGTAKITDNSSNKIRDVEFIDLPGTYSLYPKSLDEKVSFEVLTDPLNKDYPDIVILIADASNLKRNLLLASQIIDLKRPAILALNMIDIAEDLGYEIDSKRLEQELGIPVVELNSREKKGINTLEQKIFTARISELLEKNSHGNLDENLLEEIKINFQSSSGFGSLLRMASELENNSENIPVTIGTSKENVIQKIGGKEFFTRFEKQDNLERFKLINVIWEKCVSRKNTSKAKTISEKIDDVLTHRFFGVLIFMCVLFLIFQSIFFLADFPMKWIEGGFAELQQWTKNILPHGVVNDLIADGILAGFSGIVVFVPQIVLLFGFLAILEDTGYMARVSFIMDKMMRGFGLNGRSVIPLMSGVACAVPAIMGARTISNVKERLITILVTPLMSCSARLPVYTLLISLMVPEKDDPGFFNEKGMWMMGLYLLGFVSAILVALVFKFILRAKERSYFIMELPVYRKPQIKNVLMTIYEKVKVFLWDAGRVIMIISIVLWFLSSYGPGDQMKTIEKKWETVISECCGGTKRNSDSGKEGYLIMKAQEASEKLEASYAGHLGKFIEPAIKPLGFDWKIGISLITSFAAREVFVGTMATIYSSGSDEVKSVRVKLAEETDPKTGKKIYTKAVCMSLLIFYVFAMQCMSTLAVVKRETKSWKWPLVQFLFMGIMAWAGSFIVFNLFK